ncbi:MAG: tetratricopeptide repeat protein, partial [Proteobacteria bacterium]|nr:tetratricopeptide repeat protein [Pseudomonadota bacterium]
MMLKRSIFLLLLPVAVSASEYVGSAACAMCHETAYTHWQASHHQGAMLPADPETVLGDFADTTVEFHGISTRFYRENGAYQLETIDGDGKRQSFPVIYTFGLEPLQQYLVSTGQGKLQAFNIAWDSRTRQTGGQRWFHLRPDEEMSPAHPFFWTRHFQNWNSRCADCHSTAVQKNFSQEMQQYDTRFSEPSVGCEACHGPGSDHLEAVSTGRGDHQNGYSGRLSSPVPMQWVFEEGNPIAVPRGQPSDHEIDMCGACHSRRTPLTLRPLGRFHEDYAIELIRSPAYRPDGQIQEEVFVLGSFLQSRMYAAGVTCTNCHEPHSGNLLIEGNGLCAQCHQPAVFESPVHYGQSADAGGIVPAGMAAGQCVDCHMPATTYMQLDGRRDHSFVRPRVELARISEQLDQGNVSVVPEALELLRQGNLTTLRAASLLARMEQTPTRETVSEISQRVRSDELLVRRGAARAAAGLPPAWKWQLLSPLVDDENRSVRFEVASVLADAAGHLAAEDRQRLEVLLNEYRAMLAVTADFPATQVALGILELNLGHPAAAVDAFQMALQIEPLYLPGLLNLADTYRALGRDAEAGPLLQRAVQIAPDSGAANHSLGLYLVRHQQNAQALRYLAAAVEQADASPRYAYIYGVALENAGRIDEAIQVLFAADQRW